MLSLPHRVFDHGILAAISGGADSVALLHLFMQSLPSHGKLAVAHINHGLRGAESDGDAAFVRTLATEYGLRYFEHQIESDPKRMGMSENCARTLRYRFLVHQAEQIGFRYLATAHTADDQTETVLHRIFRGTSLSGLAGMVYSRSLTPAVTLLHPLLHVRRKNIIAYLESLNKTFRQDQTNFENKFTRNRIRNILLPMLRQQFNPHIDESVCRLATLAAEQESLLNELLDGILESALTEHLPNRIALNVVPLQHYSPALIRNVLVRLWKRQGLPMREMDYTHWQSLTTLFFTEDSQLDFPGGILAARSQNVFVIAKVPPFSQECH